MAKRRKRRLVGRRRQAEQRPGPRKAVGPGDGVCRDCHTGSSRGAASVGSGVTESRRFGSLVGLQLARPAVATGVLGALKRDFQAFVDRGGEAARIGSALLEQVGHMFGLWHRVCDGTLSRPEFQSHMQPIQTRVGELLREGVTLTCDKTRRTCENLLDLEVALWTFVRVEGVEPTNNDTERRGRRAVLWRRRSFGTQSEEGSRFVERVLTTVTTLRQQNRDVLDYLTEACAAAIRGDKPPSLLPDTMAIHTAA